MNKERRGILRRIAEEHRDVHERLTDVCEDEEYSIQNTPESLQGTDRFCEAEEALDTLCEANESIESAIEQISSVI